MTVSKINGWRAPYRAETFRQIADSQVGRNGILEILGEITQVGSTITIPPFKVIQNGLIYSKDVATSKPVPSMQPPYYLVVSSPTATNTDNLIFSFAQSPADVTDDMTILASYDGDGWRIPELVSVDALIKEHHLQNIVIGNVGPYDGLKTSIVASEYVTTPGDLIDKNGERQSFVTTVTNPVIDTDADWQRVDRILFRRPKDSPVRDGTIKFVLGGAFEATPSHIRDHVLFAGANTQHSKTVIASDNTAYVFCTVGSLGSYTLKYAKLSSDRTIVITSSTTIISGLTSPEFDVVISKAFPALPLQELIHIVYAVSGDILYQRMALTGSLVGAAFTVDSQSDSKNPRCKLDPNHTNLFVVYEAMNGAFSQLYATSRDVSDGGQALTVRKITETGGSASNMINPDLAFDNDFCLHLVWENLTSTSIEYQRFDSYLVAVDVAPVTVSAATSHGVGTLVNGAKNPRVQVSDDMLPFIAFLQLKSGSYGVSIWTPEFAVMRDFFTSENFLAFDLYVEPIFNGPALMVSRAASVDYLKLHSNFFDTSVSAYDFKVTLSSGTSPAVSLVRDNLGAMIVAWQDPTTGGSVAKTPAESYWKAFSTLELPGDVLLARMVQPDDVVLNWILHGRPGSFYDFLMAHGSGVSMDWASDVFTLGAGLKILDMFTGIDYSVVPSATLSDYTMHDGQALYVILDGITTTVTPQAADLALVPWDEGAVVLGVNVDSQFNPAVMGVAGMVQMDNGEKIIFGEDLPQTIRSRLGITSETSYEVYQSTIGINLSDTYPGAFTNLDLMAGQNRHTKLVRLDAQWSRQSANVLQLMSSCYVQIPGLPEARNEIQAGSFTLASDGQVAYVSLNRRAGVPAALTVRVDATISSLTPTRDTFILARRVGDKLFIDSLGKAFEKGSLITEDLETEKRTIPQVQAVDATSTILPSGPSCVIGGYTLTEGKRVLFAQKTLAGIYQINGVGSSITWAKLKEFNGNDIPSHGDRCQVLRNVSNHDTTIMWQYDEGINEWIPAELTESNKIYLGLDANNPDKAGGEYQDQLVSGQTNNVVLEGDPLETAIKRLDVRQDVVKRVKLIDRTLATLPVTSATIDGVALTNGDKVLFCALSSAPGIYQVAGSSWSARLYEFGGEQTPTEQDLVMVYGGSEINRTLWAYDTGKGWYRATTVDDLISVRAADFTTTALPLSGPVVVDGLTILEGELVLYGNGLLNKIYKVSYIGPSLFEPLNVFMGNPAPRDGSTVLVQDGTVSDVVYEYDLETTSWQYLTLTTQNKTYLGLNSPSKAGGEFSGDAINNIVREDDTLEEAIIGLDLREDVLKRVRVIDLSTLVLPSAVPTVIDGATVATGDKVLFGALTTNPGIYQATVAGTISWVRLYEFGGAQSPSTTEVVVVREGTARGKTIWQYNTAISPPWHRLAGAPEHIWTGADAATAPTFGGTLSSADTDLAKSLLTIDKYFRSLQLRAHPTNPNRVVITSPGVTKTDGTQLRAIIGSKVMSFAGAEIDFITGEILRSDGGALLGSFVPGTITNSGDYLWYSVGFLSTETLQADNTIYPVINIDVALAPNAVRDDALKPNLSSEYVIGEVVVQKAPAGIEPIVQSSLVQIGEVNNAGVFQRIADLEAAIVLHTTEINELQNAISSILAKHPQDAGVYRRAGRSKDLRSYRVQRRVRCRHDRISQKPQRPHRCRMQYRRPLADPLCARRFH